MKKNVATRCNKELDKNKKLFFKSNKEESSEEANVDLKNFFSFSFGFEKLGIKAKNITDFQSYLEKEVKYEKIDDNTLESQDFLDATLKYIQSRNSDDFVKKKKNQDLNFLRIFITEICDLQNFVINKKNLHFILKEIERAKNSNRRSHKEFKEPKNQNFFRFSFPFESLEFKYIDITRFKCFLEKTIEMESIDEQFLESEELVNCTKKFLQSLKEKRIHKSTFFRGLNTLKVFFSKLVEKKDLEIDKSFLCEAVEIIENFKSLYLIYSKTTPSNRSIENPGDKYLENEDQL